MTLYPTIITAVELESESHRKLDHSLSSSTAVKLIVPQLLIIDDSKLHVQVFYSFESSIINSCHTRATHLLVPAPPKH